MRNSVVLGVFVSLFLSQAALAEPALDFNNVFIPSHFYEGDVATATFTGFVDNTCAEPMADSVAFSGGTLMVDLGAAIGEPEPGMSCSAERTPFSLKVQLGSDIPAGTFPLLVNGSPINRTLTVRAFDGVCSGEETTMPAPCRYASIKKIDLIRARALPRYWVDLAIEHSTTCETVEKFQLIESDNTFTVISLVHHKNEGMQECLAESRLVTYRVFLGPLPVNQTKMIHARGSEGNLEKIFTVN